MPTTLYLQSSITASLLQSQKNSGSMDVHERNMQLDEQNLRWINSKNQTIAKCSGREWRVSNLHTQGQ
jgi:hypothetical protein